MGHVLNIPLLLHTVREMELREGKSGGLFTSCVFTIPENLFLVCGSGDTWNSTRSKYFPGIFPLNTEKSEREGKREIDPYLHYIRSIKGRIKITQFSRIRVEKITKEKIIKSRLLYR